jgi:hypothetical protein
VIVVVIMFVGSWIHVGLLDSAVPTWQGY